MAETVQQQCRPGYIEIPYDLVDKPIKMPSHLQHAEVSEGDAESLAACIEEAVAAINNAKKPVILAGIELHRHGLTDQVMRIAEKFNIPVAATLLAKSVFREVHPLYIGVYSGAFSEKECQDYVDESDCVIMLGTFITDMLLGVYTSRLHRKNSILVTTEKAMVGYHGYDGVLFDRFIDGLEKADITKRETFDNPLKPTSIEPVSDTNRDKVLRIDDFFNVLEQRMPEGSTIVSDTGDAVFGAMRVRTSKRRNFLSDAYYLSMGFAVPGAIGAMANREAQVGRTFAIVGDGAFQMTGMELSTAARYGMAPIVCVLNNDGFGTQRYILDGPFNEIQMWDYTRVPEILRSGKGVRVTTLGELDDALAAAVANEKELTLIEVTIPRDDSSKALRSVGESLAKLRNPSGKKAG